MWISHLPLLLPFVFSHFPPCKYHPPPCSIPSFFLFDHSFFSFKKTGSVSFDGETIEGATPLWCAAAAGHIDVVSKLVEAGASVNKTTITNSTPLRFVKSKLTYSSKVC